MSELRLRKLVIPDESDHTDIYWCFMLGDTIFKLEGATRKFSEREVAVNVARSKNLTIDSEGVLHPMPKMIALHPDGTSLEEITAAQDAGYELIHGGSLTEEEYWDTEGLLAKLEKIEKRLAPDHVVVNHELGKVWAHGFVIDHVGAAHAIADSVFRHGVFRRVDLSEDEQEVLVLHVF